VTAEIRADGALALSYRKSEAEIAGLLDVVRDAGVAIRDVTTEEPDLEDVFVALTRSAA